MNNLEFKIMLEDHPEMKQDIFIRGFMLTDNLQMDLSAFPFFGNWKEERFGGFRFCAHNLTGMHLYKHDSNRAFFLFGHAYDPITLEYQEMDILKRLALAYGSKNYQDIIDGITGIFVLGSLVDGKLEFQVDAAGMQSACCGLVKKNFYLSSHPQAIGDVENLEIDEFIKELVEYKWYGRVMGPYLPADLTPFSNIKRIVPSNDYEFTNGIITHKRIWPIENQPEAVSLEDYQMVIKEAAEILRNNMELVSKKWKQPWISLTGGIDSNTTFAAANGLYDKFETFSYISADKEAPDAAAAKLIAETFGVNHHEFQIPLSNADLNNHECVIEILRHNNGYIAETPANEARKRQYLRQNIDCDVEIKSWVSETIRAYWYKHFERKSFPALSGKLYRNLYKIWIVNRKLAHKVDKLFNAFIDEYEYHCIPDCYPPADVFFNEVTWGSWGGLNISEMKYITDITIIYNNRKLLETLFRAPLEKRISDQHHLDIKRYLNPKLSDMDIRVKNLKETKTRARLLNCIFEMNRILP